MNKLFAYQFSKKNKCIQDDSLAINHTRITLLIQIYNKIERKYLFYSRLQICNYRIGKQIELKFYFKIDASGIFIFFSVFVLIETNPLKQIVRMANVYFSSFLLNKFLYIDQDFNDHRTQNANRSIIRLKNSA